MSDLHRALGDIRRIRQQVAGKTQFAGYGPAAMAVTGLLATAGALLQHWVLPNLVTPSFAVGPAGAAGQVRWYLLLWVSVAAVAAGLTAVTALTRSRRLHSGLSNEMIGMASQQFVPALVAGVLLTAVLVRCAPQAVWMLPGLWQVVYSLGIFASCRFLPRHMPAAAGWYLMTGSVCLSLGGPAALSPWTMGLAFGVGQTLVAVVLRLGASGEMVNEDE